MNQGVADPRLTTWLCRHNKKKTPRVGLEPTTLRLTAECSAIELSRNKHLYSTQQLLGNSPQRSPIELSRNTQNIILFFQTNHKEQEGHPPGKPSGQALGLLVAVSSMRYRTSTPALSTSSSSRGLTNLCYGISHLEGGFTLRCLQRLSLPNLATRLCLW